MKIPSRSVSGMVVLALCCAALAQAQRQMESLGRGVVAIHQPDGKVTVSWRLLGTDPDEVAFNLYRKSEPLPGRGGFGGFGGGGGRGPGGRGGTAGSAGVAPAAPANKGGTRPSPDPTAGRPALPPGRGGRGGFGGFAAPGEPVRLNAEPLTGPTFFIDETANLSSKTSYFVRAIVNGAEQEPGGAFALPAGALPLPYISVPLKTPEGCTPSDTSAADLDGDGEYELIVKMEQRGRDNSQAGITGETRLQAYKLDGRLLWTINMGKNIREGAHYTQFMVYDLDGDGRAEVAAKTADGTVDGKGKMIGDPNADWREPEGSTIKRISRTTKKEEEVSIAGHILRGPEYFTIFDGLTGAALATVPYVPPRHPTKAEPTREEVAAIWGDGTANRPDRYLACVAYLDGVRPSVVMCRGYYTRAVLAAWDWRDGKLTPRWVFDSESSEENKKYRGQGNHNLSVADIDDDGRDEIVYGACIIDDNGKGLYSTGWGHGDAMHVTDHVPDNPGLEVFNIQERFDKEGANMRDARTGRPIWTKPSLTTATSGGDAGEGPGRAASFNIDPRHPGSESWVAGNGGINALYNSKGEKISDRRPRSCNFAVWWDGDLLRELLDQNYVAKWNWETSTETILLRAQDSTSNNGTKATPALSADLFGDWREEIIWRTNDGKELRIYTTTIPTKHRMTTLMHDPQYRLAVAWQNTAYNQPPHPSFHIDEAAPLPKRPNITTVAAKK